MRAGKLDRVISIMRATTTVDAYGTPQETWAEYVSVRGQLIQSTTEEYVKTFGTTADTTAIFRIRYRDDIEMGDIIVLDGRSYNLREIKELGRREGLDLRCVARDQSPWP